MSAPGPAPAGRLIVGIATSGRPQIVARTVSAMAAQRRRPDLLLLSVTDPADAGGADSLATEFPVRVLVAPRGLTRQRNRILDELAPDDILVFLDDDFLMAPDYLEVVCEVFATCPDVALVTGSLIADGILGPGFDHDEAARLLARGLASPVSAALHPVASGYGCNFALRAAPVLRHGLRFDERLPLYGWLEDVDFSGQLAPHGRFVRPAHLRGVHMGTKQGRTPGLRLGYSQIANPIHLLRKGTIAPRRARRLMARNLAANLWRSLRPQPWTDHAGRLRGNLLALADLLRGRLQPERAARLGRQPGDATADPGPDARGAPAAASTSR